MFIVRPIEEKELQKELCTVCDTPYYAEDFAYLAANVNEDGTKITGILGVCQFAIDKDGGVFHTIRPMADSFDEEVMIILVRTAMSFLHRIDVAAARFTDAVLAGCPDGFAKKLSFRADDDHVYRIDLNKFFASPCHFQAEQQA